ncbi:universal stress protein [Tersicoccus solisilvae]|uniref:Universal stress protein n=1 Tax=Tersicoccus solisilvae TaxID=1882339 RepID=A0ABQ1P562_9MICC|nr:universal stress protein [Tersicoccus solisilvae]GGC89123.1 universal stress protein [Tersicoccus solisilvae]
MNDNHVRDRILVGVDGSASSIDALRQAVELARKFDAPVEAITAWVYPPLVSYRPVAGWSPEGDARDIQATAIDQAFGVDVPRDFTAQVLHGPAAGVLIEESRRARMLVLGSRGHGGFAGMLLGSVSSACAEHAHCPVLIMHNRRRQDDAGD